MFRDLLIVGTGLIGASMGMALRSAGFPSRITGWDPSEQSRNLARKSGAIDRICSTPDDALELARDSCDLVVLATPVMGILQWMEWLAPLCSERTLLTDVGSTKDEIARFARRLYSPPATAHFLPGHPMAGKERGGAELAEADLFQNTTWLFTPIAESTPTSDEWRTWVQRIGARTTDLDPARHDELCAWVSHLPQMLSTALAALLEERFADAPEIAAIGGRALRETTRLGASPYSMWRDVALTNTQPVADTLLALEQELQHVRENLRTPELREEFARANRFRARRS